MRYNWESIMSEGRIIHQNDLVRNSKEYEETWDSFILNEACQKRKTAFFCHSHNDKDLVLGLRTVFFKNGIDLYVDWTDQTMPKTPNKKTAEKLQQKISTSDVFFYLVTQNSITSTWCPWEIGYADAINKNIFVIPTTDGDHTYGNEYLQLYKIIQAIGFSNYLIKYPDDRGIKFLTESNFWEE